MSLEQQFQDFVEKYQIPQKDIQENIRRLYSTRGKEFLENYEWPDKRGHITSEEGVRYYFRRIFLDELIEWNAIQKISGIEIPEDIAEALYEKSKRFECYKLAKAIRKVCRNKLPKVITLPRYREPTISIEGLLRMRTAEILIDKEKYLEQLVAEEKLYEAQKITAEAKVPEKVQQLYQHLFEEDWFTGSEIGDILCGFVRAEKVLEISNIPPNKETTQKAYEKFLQADREYLRYSNTLHGLLWLKKVSEIKPEKEQIKKGIKSLIHISFNARNPAYYFKKLEELGDIKMPDLLDEGDIYGLKRIYFYAVRHYNPRKLKDLQEVTGVTANLTDDGYQRIYIKASDHSRGLAEAYKLIKHYKVPPSEEFFARFIERYAKIPMEGKFEMKFTWKDDLL